MEMKAVDLGFRYYENTILSDVNVDLEGNKMVSIIGPNGVGKTTLIHCFSKILKPTDGRVYVNGKDIEDYKLKELAKIIAYVPCTSLDTFPLTVTDTVLLGRNPHSKWGSLNRDLEKVQETLRLLGIEDLAMRPFNELSAGQRQKVVLARGLVQESQILLLDEPTANLDIKHQMGVTRLLRDYSHKQGIMVIMISHDLNIAAKYSDEVIMLYGGNIFAKGSPKDTINPENIEAVYGVRSKTVINNGRPHVILEDDDDPKTNICAGA
jgi:iron complex transport system ATP-binding protein